MLEPVLKKNIPESGLGSETVVLRYARPLQIRRRARRVVGQLEISSESLWGTPVCVQGLPVLFLPKAHFCAKNLASDSQGSLLCRRKMLESLLKKNIVENLLSSGPCISHGDKKKH